MEDEGRWWRSGDADVVEEESSICVRDKVNGWDPRVMEQGDARVPLATNHLQEGFSAGDVEAVGHEQLLATNCCAARMHTNPSRNICVQRECVVVCARIRGAQAAVGLRLMRRGLRVPEMAGNTGTRNRAGRRGWVEARGEVRACVGLGRPLRALQSLGGAARMV